MAIHLHEMKGCGPTPLAQYLKAWGILRLLAEQGDPGARGWWKGEIFVLASNLKHEELERFFLEEYAPTPLAAPWSGGSGFFPKDNKRGINAVKGSTVDRFRAYRDSIEQCERLLSEMGITQKLEGKDKKKSELISRCFEEWRGSMRAWLNSAIVMTGEGEPKYPALWGTGGNDGHLDFTNNAMQRLEEMFDMKTGKSKEGIPELLRLSLWSTPSRSMENLPIGQFNPGSAGGANSTTGDSTASSANPWDFLLMLEGAVAYRCQAHKRLDAQGGSMAAAPFVIHAQGAGYQSAGIDKGRGEQWMPLWNRPSTLKELTAMLGEGRLKIGRQTAQQPVDAARAIARLGTARGIDSFVRFSYLERNGQANLAVPLGRLMVRSRPMARLLDDCTGWMNRLQMEARAKNAPNSLKLAECRFSNAVLAVLTHDAAPGDWQSVLLEAVSAESLLLRNKDAVKEGWAAMPPLRPEWVQAVDDGTAEFRLAMALGNAGEWTKEGWDSIRWHWIEHNLEHQRAVYSGRDAIKDFCAVVERRSIESGMGRYEDTHRLPLQSHFHSRVNALLMDLGRFLSGHVDMQKISALGRALMAIKWQEFDYNKHKPQSIAKSDDYLFPDEAWMAIRLAALPWKLDSSMDIRCESAMLRRLVGGDAAGAAEIAIRRLRSNGIGVPFQAVSTDAQTARLWAAALVFPISKKTVRWAAGVLDPNIENSFNKENVK